MRAGEGDDRRGPGAGDGSLHWAWGLVNTGSGGQEATHLEMWCRGAQTVAGGVTPPAPLPARGAD